jgi:hypothetical protein
MESLPFFSFPFSGVNYFCLETTDLPGVTIFLFISLPGLHAKIIGSITRWHYLFVLRVSRARKRGGCLDKFVVNGVTSCGTA